MRAALIGDVHANLPALEAVLEHASSQGAEMVWNIGDFVGYGAYPNEVIERLRAINAVSIAGNYDLKVLRVPRKRKKWAKSKRLEKFRAFVWAYETLTPENRRYLADLPEKVRLQVDEVRVLLSHAGPVSNEEYLLPNTPTERLAELGRIADADLLVFGHSHQPFARFVEGVWFVNTGSVGRPDDGDQRSSYALVDIEAATIRVQHFRLPYDVETAVRAIRQNDLPEEFAQMILQGYDFNKIVSQEE